MHFASRKPRLSWASLAPLAAFAPAALLLAGCAGSAGSQVTISSQPFALAQSLQGVAAPMPSPVPPTDFRVCLARLMLHGRAPTPTASPSPASSPAPEDEDEDVDAIGFAPGLIDLGAGGAVDWAKVTIPTGFRIDGIRAKVHKDKALCHQDFSLSFQGMTTSEDIELKWRLSPPFQYDGSSNRLELSLEQMLGVLKAAVASGSFASLKTDVEGKEGGAFVH